MGRRRLHDTGLPSRVYAHKGGFIYRPAQGKAVMLGTTVLEAITAHGRLTGSGVIALPEGGSRATLGHFVDHEVARHLPKLAEATQEKYLWALGLIKTALGDLRPDQLKPKDIYGFIDGISESAGIRNLLISQFRNIYTLAVRKGACDMNPAREVRRDPAPRRTRVPTVAELEAFKTFAGPWWACYIDFKLMTGLRQKDLLELPPLPVALGQFTVELSKSKRWSESERRRVGLAVPYDVTEAVLEVLRRLYALRRPQSTQALFCNRHGRPYTSTGFWSAWDRKQKAAIAAGALAAGFHEHDIRATVASLDPDGAQRRLGHKNRSTTDIYLRQLATHSVAPLDVKTAQKRLESAKTGENIHPLRRVDSE